MKYIIASEKDWNKELCHKLNKKFPQDQFIRISKKEDLIVDNMQKLDPDIIFFPHWSHIIPEEIFNSYECIVFHMTDLPFGRGGSPLQNLISRSIYNTKITALQVVKEIDAGPIYLKAPLDLHGTAEEIFIRSNEIIEEMIKRIISEQIQPLEQIGASTVFIRRTPEMSNLQGIKEITNLYDHIRMLDADGYPKAFLENNEFRFEFSRASIKSDGTIIADVRISKK